MKKKSWKIIFTIICLLAAAGAMLGGMRAEASEKDSGMRAEISEKDGGMLAESPEDEAGQEARAEEDGDKQEEAGSDTAGPSILVRMVGGAFYDGQYYYRRDNCDMEISVSDAASALTSVEVTIGGSKYGLEDFERTDETACRLLIDAKQMSECLPEDGPVAVTVCAEDAAGNASSLETTPEEETVILLQGLSGDGEKGVFILDGTSPAAVITYSAGKPFYLYAEDGVCRAYVADSVSASIRCEDNQPLDYGRLTLEADGTQEEDFTDGTPEETFADGTEERVYSCSFDKEGRHFLEVGGTDIAGNPITVTERIDGADAGFMADPHFEIVIDRTAPVFTLSMEDPSGDESVAGDTAFYGSVHKMLKASYTISEKNFDAKRIGADMLRAKRIKTDENGSLSMQEPEVTGVAGGTGYTGAGVYTVQTEAADTVSANGVYRFGICGTDKAGNPLMMSEEEAKKEGYRASVRIGDGGYWTHEKVLDTVSPVVSLKAPPPVVAADEEVTARCPDGRGLYREDVTLQVQADDSTMMEYGIPLKEASCEISVNAHEREAYSERHALPEVRTEYTGAVTVPKGGIFESNDIEMRVYAVDYAGNRSDTAKGGSIVFGIDSEGPEAVVTFDNNDARHGNYFKAARTARVQITDRNMDAHNIRIETQADVPPQFVWSAGSEAAGNDDRYEKRIRYEADGEYTLKISGTDALGNPFQTEAVYQGTAPAHFIIDRTAPVVRFENVEDGAACSGRIAPRIVFEDANFSAEQTELTLTGAHGRNRSDLLPALTAGKTGGVCAMHNIAVKKENDDIYTASARIEDLAGNKTEEKITFSVNRFGSTYDYNGDADTEQFLEKYYSSRERNLFLREINVNRLTGHTVTVYRDGSNKVLKQGGDYRLTEKILDGSVQYIYEIFAENFSREGNYQVVVQSRDEAGNTNSNGAIRQTNGIAALPLRFVIDKTPPQIQINGTDIRRAQVFSDAQQIQIRPYDNMRLGELKLLLKNRADGEYTEVESLSSGDLPNVPDANGDALSFSFDPENGQKQVLLVQAADAAGNKSEGNVCYIRSAKRPEVQEIEERRSSHFGMLTAAAGAALLIMTWIRKRAVH